MLNDMKPALLRTVYGITPSFNIYQANGKRKEGLKKAFVEIMDLVGNESTIELQDRSHWPCYFELPNNEFHNRELGIKQKFICSFQVYENGDYFAVARLYKDKVKG